jgi:hypothetical protein
MTRTFPAKKVEHLRKQAGKAAELPEGVPSGWSKSLVDPMALLAVFEPLRLKDGYTLRAYQFREGGNGNGFVWALPVDADFPDPEDCPRLANIFLEPPKPPAALDDFMEAIDGDGTPWSYICASILAREMAEFGAMWHGCDWDTHTILGVDPLKNAGADASDDSRVMGSEADWQWDGTRPKRWNPRVSQGSETVKVKFFTHSGLGQEAVYRHTDTYKLGTYRFKSERKQIATGPGGYVF